MRFNPLTLFGIVFLLASGIFIVVGGVLVWSSFAQSHEVDRLAALPVLKASQLNDTPPGTEALIEGRAAERNPLLVQGFVAYIKHQYQGQRCETDDDGYRDCESIWTEIERVTPALWLDLADGRVSLANSNYTVENPPVTWQSGDTLVDYETVRYHGFKINSPLMAVGAVVQTEAGPAFEAARLYGGDRPLFLAAQQGESNSMFWGGIIFGTIGGGVFGIIGLLALSGVLK